MSTTPLWDPVTRSLWTHKRNAREILYSQRRRRANTGSASITKWVLLPRRWLISKSPYGSLFLHSPPTSSALFPFAYQSRLRLFKNPSRSPFLFHDRSKMKPALNYPANKAPRPNRPQRWKNLFTKSRANYRLSIVTKNTSALAKIEILARSRAPRRGYSILALWRVG